MIQKNMALCNGFGVVSDADIFSHVFPMFPKSPRQPPSWQVWPQWGSRSRGVDEGCWPKRHVRCQSKNKRSQTITTAQTATTGRMCRGSRTDRRWYATRQAGRPGDRLRQGLWGRGLQTSERQLKIYNQQILDTQNLKQVLSFSWSGNGCCHYLYNTQQQSFRRSQSSPGTLSYPLNPAKMN